MRTWRLTCSGVASLSRLITAILSAAAGSDVLMPGLSAASASRSTCALSEGEATVPLSTVIWPTVVVRTSASGMAARSMRSSEERFWLTRTEAEYSTSPPAVVAKMVASPSSLPNRWIWRGLPTYTSATVALEVHTSVTADGSVISSPSPIDNITSRVGRCDPGGSCPTRAAVRRGAGLAAANGAPRASEASTTAERARCPRLMLRISCFLRPKPRSRCCRGRRAPPGRAIR